MKELIGNIILIILIFTVAGFMILAPSVYIFEKLNSKYNLDIIWLYIILFGIIIVELSIIYLIL
jgi:hypothetical protein